MGSKSSLPYSQQPTTLHKCKQANLGPNIFNANCDIFLYHTSTLPRFPIKFSNRTVHTYLLPCMLQVLLMSLSVAVWFLGRGHTILTSRELMWCCACGWDVRGDLTFNSMAQIHTSVTLLRSRDLTWSSGRHTCQHASQRRAGTYADQSSTWDHMKKQSDRSVNMHHRIQC